MKDREKIAQEIMETAEKQWKAKKKIHDDTLFKFWEKYLKRTRELTTDEAIALFIDGTVTLDDIPGLFDPTDEDATAKRDVFSHYISTEGRVSPITEAEREFEAREEKSYSDYVEFLITYGPLDEQLVASKGWQKYSKEAMKRCYIKIGRCCFTCRFRESRKGSFITCKHNNNRKPIWDKAHCSKHRLTLDKKRLVKMEMHIDKRLRNTIKKWRYINHLYKKTSKIGVKDRAPIKLGQCCFLCSHRDKSLRNNVNCTHHDRLVWDKAVCRHFNLTKEPKRLSKFKPHMKKTGLNTFGDRWMYGK